MRVSIKLLNATSSMMNKPVRIAVFDIDGTIFRSSLLIEYMHEMVRHGVFSQAALDEIEPAFHAWLDRQASYHDYIMKVVDVHLRYLSGAPLEGVHASVMSTVDSLKNRNYRYTTHLLRELKEAGYRAVCVSGSPHHVVEPFARLMGFDEWFGTIYEVRDGAYTGEVVLNNSIAAKDVVIDQWAAEEGIEIDFDASYAIGDTEGDASVLSRVGNPIAFNPNMALLQVAREQGWKIIVERKDVIYDIRESEYIIIP